MVQQIVLNKTKKLKLITKALNQNPMTNTETKVL